MKIFIRVEASKSPQSDEELEFMREIMTNGKFEEWRQEATKALYAILNSELDNPDLLEVHITVDYA